jgi:hypothetical protein
MLFTKTCQNVKAILVYLQSDVGSTEKMADIKTTNIPSRNRGRLVSMVTMLNAGRPGSIPGRAGFFSSPQRPDRFRSPPSLLSNGYRGPFPGDKAVGA